MTTRRQTRGVTRIGMSGNSAAVLPVLPVPAKLAILAIALAVVSLLAVSNALEYRSFDVADAGAATAGQSILDAGGPLTTCSADGQTHAAPYVITLTAVSQDTDIADTFYSVDHKPFVSGMLVSLTGGTHTLRFYSTNAAGDVGPTSTATVTVR